MADYDEHSPLLGRGDDDRLPSLDHYERYAGDQHAQFCLLTGIPPSNLPKGKKKDWHPPSTSLYERASKKRRYQQCVYLSTASLSNLLLLSQVVLGATLTALGANQSSYNLITVFGALNTIIAGVVAYLKSRGQPMRARMFRDDLERVVDEIENSEIMWLGISKDMHGYDEINIDDQVSVRSEVARLTRLYDKAVRNSALSNPDFYMAGSGNDALTALRSKPAAGQQAPQTTVSAAVVPEAGSSAAPAVVVPDPDESPATAKPKAPTPTPPSPKGDDDAAAKSPPNGAKPDAPAPPASPGPSTAAPTPAPASDAAPAPPASPQPEPLAEDIDEGPVTAVSVNDNGKADSSKTS